MQLVLASLAAVCFTLGGVYMKRADGLQHLWPAAAFLLLFAAGATLQSHAMRGAQLSVTCVIVLGLEAAFATAFGLVLFGEALTRPKLLAILLIAIGVGILRRA